MRQGLAAHRATGAELGRPHHLTSLAEAYRKVGQTEEGLSVLAEALDIADKKGQGLTKEVGYQGVSFCAIPDSKGNTFPLPLAPKGALCLHLPKPQLLKF